MYFRGVAIDLPAANRINISTSAKRSERLSDFESIHHLCDISFGNVMVASKMSLHAMLVVEFGFSRILS